MPAGFADVDLAAIAAGNGGFNIRARNCGRPAFRLSGSSAGDVNGDGSMT